MDKPAVRVLLVDDDEDEHVIVGDLLRAASTEKFEVIWAPTYERGLQAILAGCYDVCLVDYQLGRRTGLDLLAEVTGKPGHPQVILMTGSGDRDVDVTAAKAGAADYLVKGELTAALLERSIRYAAERGHAQRALRAAIESQSLNLAKSGFLAAMSHEMRTPMNAILGMADMLVESPLNSEQTRYVEVLRRAGSGLLVLINDILDLSKIEAGNLELARVEFDLEEVVDQVIGFNATKARAKHLVLLSHLSPGIATSLLGDPIRLKQILTNLLGNAIKFTISGEVVLTARNHESGKAGEIEFAVSDTGIGIPAEKLETIFDNFTQADASATRKYGGAGLGLAISRRLVEAMGGGLSATSCEGQGSTFRFTAQFDPMPENSRMVREPRRQLHAERALLIDDNATSGVILGETLRAWGLETSTYRSPAEAIATLRGTMADENPYSLVVIATSGKPGMDGFDTAAEVKRIAPALSIVLLASDARPGDTARRAKAGLSGYAVKPVARAHLLRLVCDALEACEGPDLDRTRRSNGIAKQSVKQARILLVEDSADNRLLLQAYLKGSPYRLTFEEDGKAAVERFAVMDFDLILMDVQMPVMDGLAATRAIRALEQERDSAAIPILALTANTNLQDMERSMNAGCNAHLAKPISKLDLLSAIEKYRRLDADTRRSGSLEPSRIEMPPGLENIVPDYLSRRRKEVPEMLELLAKSDFPHLASLAHDLKGSGGGYGFPELTRLGNWLEQSAKQEDTKALRTQIAALGDYLKDVQLIAKT